ncbi:BspA family leucine-rich repeat surface protein [Mycoplasma cottewii]|uniref:BspA family leucine-rich repeat surface protein n=1 Tax=Mycoplasma cottewii TaxID=51364 RepID=A0ABY5TXI4_9MOLU|nr:BspA family leucine-rich repeat surface protein [Mycoplasma cottewii]UWD35389.1 BspA family leucine-rich repeat surface protein [Mycoplasma cottewii]
MVSRKKLSSLFIALSLSLSAIVPTSAVLINNHITRLSLSKDQNDAESLVNNLNGQITNLRNAIQRIGQEIDDKSSQLQTLKESNTKLQSEVDDLTIKIGAFKNFWPTIEEALKEHNIDFDYEKIKDLNIEKLEDVTNENREKFLLAVLAFYNSSKKEFESSSNDIKNTIRTSIEYIESLISQKNFEIEQFKQAVQQLVNIKSSLQIELTQLAPHLHFKKLELEKKLKEERDLNNKIEDLKSKKEKLDEQLRTLPNQFNGINSVVNSLFNKIWEEEFKDHLLNSETYSEIKQQFEDRINQTAKERVSFQLVSEQQQFKQDNSRETNFNEPLKLKLNDNLYEFKIGKVWPARENFEAFYPDQHPDTCTDIGYTWSQEEGYKIERFKTTTKVAPKKLPRFITTLDRAFEGNDNSKIEGIQHWNTENVTGMWRTFAHTPNFNQDISNWDMSNVKITQEMFWNAKKFNQDINNWNMNNVLYVNSMFDGASSFNKNINNWKLNNVVQVDDMFKNASSFDQYLNKWDLYKVSDEEKLKTMFKGSRIEKQFSKLPPRVQELLTEVQSNLLIDDLMVPLIKNVWNHNFKNNKIKAMAKYSNVLSIFQGKVNELLDAFSDEKGYLRLAQQESQKNARFPLNNKDKNRTFNIQLVAGNVKSSVIVLPIEQIVDTECEAEYNHDNTVCEVIGFSKNNSPQFGKVRTEHMPKNIRKVPDFLPEQIDSIEGIFRGGKVAEIENLNKWDTRNLMNISSAFRDNDSFNTDISNWNTSNVKFFDDVFNGATSFNKPLDSRFISIGNRFFTAWNVSEARAFRRMFLNAKKFNQDLNNWEIGGSRGRHVDMESMFEGAEKFNGKVKDWNVSSVINFKRMFYKAKDFLRSVSKWDMSAVNNSELRARTELMFNETAWLRHACQGWVPKVLFNARIYFPSTACAEWVN